MPLGHHPSNIPLSAPNRIFVSPHATATASPASIPAWYIWIYWIHPSTNFLRRPPPLILLTPLCAASIPAWYIWIYWINPLAYAIRALLVNEMNTNAWGMPVVVGMDGSVPQYDALGLLALQSRGFQMQTWCALQGS